MEILIYKDKKLIFFMIKRIKKEIINLKNKFIIRKSIDKNLIKIILFLLLCNLKKDNLFGKIPKDILNIIIFNLYDFNLEYNKKIKFDVILDKNYYLTIKCHEYYPFKPPKFFINGIASHRIKEYNDINNDDFKKLIDMYNIINEWSPMLQFIDIIDLVKNGILLHKRQNYDTNFIKDINEKKIFLDHNFI